MADLYYCVKCKKKTEMKNARRVTIGNNKPALKGQCVECDATMQTLAKKEK